MPLTAHLSSCNWYPDSARMDSSSFIYSRNENSYFRLSMNLSKFGNKLLCGSRSQKAIFSRLTMELKAYSLVLFIMI